MFSLNDEPPMAVIQEKPRSSSFSKPADASDSYAQQVTDTIKKSGLFHFTTSRTGTCFNCYAHHEPVTSLITLMVNKLIQYYPEYLTESDRSFLCEKPTPEECTRIHHDIKVIANGVLLLIDTKNELPSSNTQQQERSVNKMDVLRLKRDILRVGSLVHLYKKSKRSPPNKDSWIWNSFEKSMKEQLGTIPETVLMDGCLVAPKNLLPKSKKKFNEDNELEETDELLRLAFAMDIGFVKCNSDEVSEGKWLSGMNDLVEKLENYE